MSVKRQATTELNHENWDQDDPADHEEMGSFKTAAKDVLEKRVIRTAKRRSQFSTGDDAKKSVFSGFGGFNKTQPSSFDFLANLTNGNKNTSGSSCGKSETAATSSLFNSKALLSSSNSGVFSMPATSASPTKSTFGIPTSQTSPLFGVSSTNTISEPSIFTSTKADSTVGSPFKIEATSTSIDSSSTVFTTKTTNAETNVTQVSSSIFGVSSTNLNNNKSVFSNIISNSTPFKIQPASNTTTPVQTNLDTTNKALSNSNESDKKLDKNSDSKKLNYYAKLKGLNESVSDWIKKHVEETPLCILSPIFKDYEKYLKEIQDEYQSPNKEDNQKVSGSTNVSGSKSDTGNITSIKSSTFTGDKSGSSLFPNKDCLKTFTTNTNQNNTSSLETKTMPFSFGINTSTSPSVAATTNTGFSFGISQSNTAITTSAFSLSTNTASANGTAPFSFGMGKPYSFSSNIQKSTEATKEEKEEEDEPPKVEFTPVVEENSVYDKRCKIFVKKDGNFADKGVGTLYIKKIEESGKHQLLVRANTNLGNVLLNLILASAIPTQRMGKNNVMMVCIPTPESKPPPTPVLIRVKTSEEADELLETLNKYKV